MLRRLATACACHRDHPHDFVRVRYYWSLFQVLRNIGLQAIICSTRRGDEETAGIENIHSCAIRREGAAYRSDWRNGRPGLIRLSVSKSHDEGRNKHWQYREFPHSESFGRGNRGRTGPLLGRAYSPCSLPFAMSVTSR